MAGKKLRENVTVSDPEGGTSKTYMAGEEVPDDVAALINAPGVWEGDEEPAAEETVPGEAQFAVVDEEAVADKMEAPGAVKPAPAKAASKAAPPTPAK